VVCLRWICDLLSFIPFSGCMLSLEMLCCSGEKDTGRDLKSAQNTPSRQPMHQPYPQPQPMPLQPHPQPLGPPPLLQNANRYPPPMTQLNNFCKDDFRKVIVFFEVCFFHLWQFLIEGGTSDAICFKHVNVVMDVIVTTSLINGGVEVALHKP